MTDLLFVGMPYYGLILSGIVLAWNWMHPAPAPVGAIFQSPTVSFLANIGLARYGILLAGIGLLIRLSRSFGNDYKPASIADLVGEVKVSHIRCIPVEIEGTVIGRGVPGLFWSKDLVMQDETGFITLIYRQPIGLLETLFGAFKADSLVGKKGTFRGWFRRGPSPYLELKEAQFESGERIGCHRYKFVWAGAVALTLFGAALALAL